MVYPKHVFILFSPSSLIIHVNISLCDTTFYTTDNHCTTDDGLWFIRNMFWLNNMNFKNIVWFIKAI